MKKMKKRLGSIFGMTILVMLAVFGLQARASADNVSGSAGFGYGHNAADPILGYSTASGSLGTVFANVKYDGAYASFQYVGANHDAHETVATLGYVRDLGGCFKGDVSYTYDTSNGVYGTTHRLAASLDTPSLYGVTPNFVFGRLFANNDSSLPDLWVGKAGLKTSIDAAGQPINLSAYLAGYSAINSKLQDRTFATAIFSANVPVEVVKSVFLTPYATYVVPSNYLASAVAPRFSWGINASVNF